jgi:hypothetical protein
MFRDIYLVKNSGDLAGFVNEKRRAVDAHILFAVHTLLGPDAVFLNDIFICIRDKRVWQVELGDEFLMRLFIVSRNADHLDIFLIKFVARITERTRFFGSARCVVLWIEPKHNALAAKVF